MISPGEQGLGILFPGNGSFMQESYDCILILPIMMLHVCGLRGIKNGSKEKNWEQTFRKKEQHVGRGSSLAL